MIFFWILWIFCAGMLLVLLYLFRDSIYTTPGGPSKYFYRAAIFVIGLPIIALSGSLWLVNIGFYVGAKLLLALPDLLGLAFMLYLVIYWIGGGSKN